MIEIPLTLKPEQLFSIIIGSVTYNVRVLLNSRTGIWSISLSQDGEDIILGVPLLGGVDIFKQHNIPIKNAYVIDLADSKRDPTSTNLGAISKLFILTDEEIEQSLTQA